MLVHTYNSFSTLNYATAYLYPINAKQDPSCSE